MVQGSCLCGAVAFEAAGPLRDVVACHCTQCRKTSGHFWAATSVPMERFDLTRDEGLAWFRSSPQAERGHCRRCGSTLFWKHDAEDRISIGAGAIDGPTGLTTAKHIFMDDAGDYYTGGTGVQVATLHGRCLCGGCPCPARPCGRHHRLPLPSVPQAVGPFCCLFRRGGGGAGLVRTRHNAGIRNPRRRAARVLHRLRIEPVFPLQGGGVLGRGGGDRRRHRRAADRPHLYRSKR